METVTFQLRTYGRQELAILYNPEVKPDTAVKRLNQWIDHHPTLIAELTAVGWNQRIRHYTPMMVDVLVRHLGEP